MAIVFYLLNKNTINYILMFVLDMIIPFLFWALGVYLYLNYPKKINNSVGYRTKRSKKNNHLWIIAQEYSSYLFKILGVVEAVVSFVIFVIFYFLIGDKPNSSLVLLFSMIVLQILFIFVLIYLTEQKLNEFDK